MGSIVIKPPAPLTHQELLIDFLDMDPNSEFSVNVTGPLAQPYWSRLRAGPDGHAQLFWRTQAPGDYTVQTGDKLSATFTVSRQAGEAEPLETVAAVKTVDPEPEPEPTKPKSAPKPRARRKTSATRK